MNAKKKNSINFHTGGKDGSIITNVYRKPTCSIIYTINEKSNHRRCHKVNIYYNVINGAFIYTNDNQPKLL